MFAANYELKKAKYLFLSHFGLNKEYHFNLFQANKGYHLSKIFIKNIKF